MGKVIRFVVDDETALIVRRTAREMGIGVCGLLKRWIREDIARQKERRRQERVVQEFLGEQPRD